MAFNSITNEVLKIPTPVQSTRRLARNSSRLRRKNEMNEQLEGYYRASTLGALASPQIPPFSLIAAEHTAQIGNAQANDVFSKAEENELLFQDVNLGADDSGHIRPAIDVLSRTTTMEVGIDIGAFSGFR
jgi:hypothetical protein